MTYKIDDAVPVPENKTNGRARYPFRDMAVGQSFFVPGKTSTQLANAATHVQNKTELRFTSRAVTENGVKGVRVWRVA